MKDLARALGVASIRVVETIPGKTCMGLELPNPRRQMIHLSEVLSSEVFRSHGSKLAMVLGKDITITVKDGKVFLNDVDVMGMSDEQYRKEVRWVRMSMVPQAAMNSLNPVLKVGDQVAEPMMVHHGVSKEAAIEQARTMFQRVGVPVDFVGRYAFELSGGMRQRVAIAMALVTMPDLVILDEPTSALDVLTQANIMNLLKRIKKEISTSFILITHDIATSSELADRVAVMYAGQIVEVSDSYRFFSAPLHPYSAKLMASVPKLRSKVEPDFITGQPPSLIKPPTGCRFAARCPKRFEKCSEEPPVISKDGRLVKCWLYT